MGMRVSYGVYRGRECEAPGRVVEGGRRSVKGGGGSVVQIKYTLRNLLEEAV